MEIKLTKKEIELIELKAKALPKTTEATKSVYIRSDLDELIEELEQVREELKGIDDLYVTVNKKYMCGYNEYSLDIHYTIADNQATYIEELKAEALQAKKREYSMYQILKSKFEGEEDE